MIPYTGPERLLLTIDVGDNSSSISITHLEFGKSPCPRSVTRYPGSTSANAVRLPSLVAYDERDKPVAIGFDVLHSSIQTHVKNDGWLIASHFKQQLGGHVAVNSQTGDVTKRRSNGSLATNKTGSQSDISSGLPAFTMNPTAREGATSRHSTSSEESGSSKAATLQKKQKSSNGSKLMAQHGPTLKQVFADYVKYLVACARSWWSDAVAEGDDDRKATFDRLWPTTIFVFSHPADWTSKETDVIREAFVLARLLPRDFAPGRLHFVRESASISHFAKKNSDASTWLRPKSAFIVVNAEAAGTSLAGYIADAVEPRLKLRAFETHSSLAIGTETITQAFKSLLDSRLPRKWRSKEDDMRSLVSDFETNVVRRYTGSEDAVPIKLSSKSAAVSDSQVGIHSGQLYVRKSDMVALFRPFLEPLFVRLSSMTSQGRASAVVLVGELGECAFVRKSVKEHLDTRIIIKSEEGESSDNRIKLVTTDIPSLTSISEGSAQMYVSETVFTTRLARSIGVGVGIDWSSSWTPESSARQVVSSVHGDRRLVEGRWCEWLEKGTTFEVGQTRSKEFHFVYAFDGDAREVVLGIELFARITKPEFVNDNDHKGKMLASSSEWVKTPSGQVDDCFEPIGRLEADLSDLVAYLRQTQRKVRQRTKGGRAQEYVFVNVRLVAYHGRHSLECRIAWDMEGTEERGPALEIPRSLY